MPATHTPLHVVFDKQEFTFTLTHGDGRRFQGFCRKHLPPPPKTGSRLRLPQVICIISEHSWCPFFFKALQSIEQILRPSSSPTTKPPATLPAGSDVELFLTALASELSKDPLPGQTVLVPLKSSSALNGSSPMPRASSSSAENQLELQVPPDCGNGRSNCGIPLARLLWHLPVSSVLTLIASMMLERRIVIVGQSRDTVTATVQV